MTIQSITDSVFEYLDIAPNPQAGRLLSLLLAKHKLRNSPQPPTEQEIDDLESIEKTYFDR